MTESESDREDLLWSEEEEMEGMQEVDDEEEVEEVEENEKEVKFELSESRLDEAQVRKGIQVGKRQMKQIEDQKLIPTLFVSADIIVKKLDRDQDVKRPKFVQLPHPLRDLKTVKTCLFIKDKDLGMFQKYSKDHKLPIQKIVSFKHMGSRTNLEKQDLAKKFDVFFIDDRLLKEAVKTLGPTFYRKKQKIPAPIRINLKTDSTADKIRNILQSTPFIAKADMASTAVVGKVNSSEDHLVENFIFGVEAIVLKKIPDGWDNVTSVSMRFSNKEPTLIYGDAGTPGKETPKRKSTGEGTEEKNIASAQKDKKKRRKKTY